MKNYFEALVRANFRFGRMWDIRLSIGTEHIDDILADLQAGFEALKEA